ncbi:thioesterase family protein [Pseudomonas sp. MWU15-20650]|uniref:acyl-CoA thioesterase n=1 Tax=Pseudomonas sp. MWU15-20650 TaxID=2933107 RepID=UPI00200EA35A|nr:thioesterase family protein [Pseudomonas sp. MWU15-20650]
MRKKYFDSGTREFGIKVPFRDVDMGGVVYHPYYLTYLEAGRDNWFSAFDINLHALIKNNRYALVVSSLDVKYKSPAFLDDRLLLRTTLLKGSLASFEFTQVIYRGETLLLEATTKVVGVYAHDFKPARLPAEAISLGEMPSLKSR